MNGIIEEEPESGLYELDLICNEPTGYFTQEEMEEMRAEGLIVEPGAFCVNIFRQVNDTKSDKVDYNDR